MLNKHISSSSVTTRPPPTSGFVFQHSLPITAVAVRFSFPSSPCPSQWTTAKDSVLSLGAESLQTHFHLKAVSITCSHHGACSTIQCHHRLYERLLHTDFLMAQIITSLRTLSIAFSSYVCPEQFKTKLSKQYK